MTRAWVHQGNGFRPLPSPAASPNAGDVVVAVEAAHLQHHELDARGVVPGIAAVGTVVAAGEEALAMLGQRVVIGGLDPCGECGWCRRALLTACTNATVRGPATRGTLAERVTAAARWALPLVGDLAIPEPHAAALGGEALAAYTLYARASVAPHDAVVVVGASPISRFLVAILRAKGIAPIVVAPSQLAEWHTWVAAQGAHPVRLPRATSLGALTTSLDEVRKLVSAAVVAASVQSEQARPLRILAAPGLVDRDASGTSLDSPTALEAAAEYHAMFALLATPGAQLTHWLPAELAGAFATALAHFAAAVGEAMAHEARLTGVACGHPDLLVDVAALVKRGELDLAASCNVVPLARAHLLVSEDPTRALIVALPNG